MVCSNCNITNPAEATTCLNCGKPLAPAPSATQRILEGLPPEAIPAEPLIVDNDLDGEPTLPLQAKPTPPPTPPILGPDLRLNVGYQSDVGRTRRIDEDSVLVLQFAAVCEARPAPIISFMAVADGIGGQEAGEVASRAAVQFLAADLFQNLFNTATENPNFTLEQLKEQLIAAVYTTNLQLFNFRQSKQSDMGCTLTAALACGSQAVVVNLGDSRTYWMRQGQLRQVTQDHSLVASLVAAGLAQPEEIYTHEHKSVIYRSLGYKSDLELDIFSLTLEPEDRLLLCSDGLWEMVRDPQIEAVLNAQPNPQLACQELVRLANENGGLDNISIILANVETLTATAA